MEGAAYFPWDDVLALRNHGPQEHYTVEHAREKYLTKATPCPRCNMPAEELSWVYLVSPEWTWQTSCGRAGWVTIWPRRATLKGQLAEFVAHRAFVLFWAGFIVAVPYAQLVGHAAFLESLMGDDYQRDYKRVIEELGEMLGYLLILLGSIEALLQAGRCARPQSSTPARPCSPSPVRPRPRRPS